MEIPNRSSLPDLATWPVFAIIVGLLLAALVLEIVLSAHWSDPFMEPGTWVLIGVALGFVLRGLGHWRGRRGLRGEQTLRQTSLVIWAVTALGGLLSLLF
jgi:hypothetical protein